MSLRGWQAGLLLLSAPVRGEHVRRHMHSARSLRGISKFRLGMTVVLGLLIYLSLTLTSLMAEIVHG